jgi:hypothetical protein
MLLAVVPISVVALLVGYFLRLPGLPRLVPVSGTVMFDGEQLDGAEVTFRVNMDGHPADAVFLVARGITDTAGRFRLQTNYFGNNVPGVIPGSYRVTIVKSISTAPGTDTHSGEQVDPPLGAKSVIPVHYADVATSGLIAVVKQGDPNIFDFKLVSTP